LPIGATLESPPFANLGALSTKTVLNRNKFAPCHRSGASPEPHRRYSTIRLRSWRRGAAGAGDNLLPEHLGVDTLDSRLS
jgi:hypothetical protein